MHAVEFAATVTPARQTPLEWSGAPVTGSGVPLRPVETFELYSRQVHPVGLFDRVEVDGETWDRRVEGTLATCCLYDDVGRPGRVVTARWRGTLVAPQAGIYSMSVFSQGALELRIDGQIVLRSATDADSVTLARPIRFDCGSGCSVNTPSAGRRPSSRVLRGGSFNNQAVNVRSANRNRNAPTNRNNNVGFRPASTLPCQHPQALPCGACQGATSRPPPRVAPSPDDTAEGSAGPAGLVGRKARRPRRACSYHGVGPQAPVSRVGEGGLPGPAAGVVGGAHRRWAARPAGSPRADARSSTCSAIARGPTCSATRWPP